MSGHDTIVVGGGIVGAACARELAHAGRRVLVLESSPRTGGGATAAGMGHIIITDDSEAQFALCRTSQQLWDELADRMPAGVQRDECGCLWLAAEDDEMEVVHEKARFYAERGIRVEVLDRAQVREAEPELHESVVGGLRVPGDSVVYPPVFADWLLQDVVARGGEVRRGCAVQRTEAGRATLSDGAVLEADVIVNAAGDRAMTLLTDPALHDYIRPRKGHLAITERGRRLTRHQVAELGYFRSAHNPNRSSVAFNVQPRVTGQMLIGSSRQFGTTDGAIEPRILARMLARAIELLPRLAELRVVRAWTGFRAATADKLPLIGAVPGEPGLYVASGHEGLGITTSLGTGRLIRALVQNEEPIIDPVPYRPDRPLAAWSVA